MRTCGTTAAATPKRHRGECGTVIMQPLSRSSTSRRASGRRMRKVPPGVPVVSIEIWSWRPPESENAPERAPVTETSSLS